MGQPKMIVAGNWKMNGNMEKVQQFQQRMTKYDNVDVVICPPNVYLAKAGASTYLLGGQNCSEHLSGAHTGEVSVSMLKEVGCEYVIIGHSERREDQHESNDLVAQKVQKALEVGLTPILCVGESLEVRESGNLFDFIGEQLDAVTSLCGQEFIHKGVVAYEPIWAIGTGKTASPEQAQEVHAFIRKKLKQMSEKAEMMSILYGGSVKADNAALLFAQPDINGGLIGGASLEVDSFSAICSAANDRN